MDRNPLNIAIQGSGLDSDVHVAVEFMKNKNFDQISRYEDKLSLMPIRSLRRGNIEETLKVTFYHDNKCSRHERTIRKFTKTIYNFIQLDKPFYKPGDEIQYRLVMLDTFLKPYDPNQIEIKLKTPRGVVVSTKNDKKGHNKKIKPGVVEDSFKLYSMAEEGNWTISAVINNNKNFKISKTFVVQKYVLPLYEVKVTTHKHITQFEDKIKISVEGRYSFGEFVVGSATVSIYDVLNADQSSNEWLFIQKGSSLTKPIKTSENFEFTLKTGLGIQSLRTDPHMLHVKVEFTDTLGSSKTITQEIFVHKHAKCKISIVNVQPYEENRPVRFDVLVQNFIGGIMKDTITPVTASSKISESISVSKTTILKDGMTSFSFEGLTKEKATFDVKFGKRCSKTFKITKERTSRYEDLVVYYKPEK